MMMGFKMKVNANANANTIAITTTSARIAQRIHLLDMVKPTAPRSPRRFDHT
jgi:hypothetical protein